MLTVAKVAFGFCFILGAFEETVSWTIDLPQVRKYFFEKSLEEKTKVPDKVVYDNIRTNSPHFDYERHRENYADEYQYHGYMEQKVHNAVRNGSAYLEGLRRAIENYTRRLEDCRRLNFTMNIIQLRPNISMQSLNDSLTSINQTNFSLPTNFTFNLPPNVTNVMQLSTNFTDFMRMSTNYTMFNISDGLKECMRADLASEHVRRLAQLAIWAANELQDKLYRDQYQKHDKHPSHDDDTLILRLAWFLERLAQLTGYDPRPEDFVPPETNLQPSPPPPIVSMVPGTTSDEDMQYLLTCLNSSSSLPAPERCAYPRNQGGQGNGSTMVQSAQLVVQPSPSPPIVSLVPVMISNDDIQFLLTCFNSSSSPDRCAFPRSQGGQPNGSMLMQRGRPASLADLRPSGSENHEYTYSEQDYADENMPLSLPLKPVTAVKKRKRSVREDPLRNVLNYYTKYKAWTGSNQEVKESSAEIQNNILPSPPQTKRIKRFIVKKKAKHFKLENPMPNLSSFVKHKFGVHFTKDKTEAKKVKNFLEKLHVLPAKTNLKIKKKTKRSVHYMRKFQPRVPTNPQGDISYYVKNKRGTNYNYNAAQAALVRAGLEQAFQTGNIEVVRRYGSNYNPANPMQILTGFVGSIILDV